MQCPSCLNENLTPSGDGRLVCDDCGEQFAGYQEEEVDFVLAGTAVSTRQSQSSQAQAVRSKAEARKGDAKAAAGAAPGGVTDDMLICEGAFILAKAIAKRLIKLRYVHERIMVPLFEILTCWVRRRHAQQHFSARFRRFQPYHVLSMICLAAVYIRSPMLPRDICRLVNTRQVPFLAALKTVFPADFRKTAAVRAAFTPTKLPAAREVKRFANEVGRGKHAWPRLARFFLTNGDRAGAVPTARREVTGFPVGHVQLTLLRLTRMLGLPDEFGARVLRFTELRRVAVKMARVVDGCTGGPWDGSLVDGYAVGRAGLASHADPSQGFSRALPGDGDLYEFATDESVQIDVVNTMRLCYGWERKRGYARKGAGSGAVEAGQRGEEAGGGEVEAGLRGEGAGDGEVEARLRGEWEGCKDGLMRWARYGHVEDLDNVGWTSLSPRAIESMGGREIREYGRLVDDVLSERGEAGPEGWGKFIRAFEAIGAGAGAGAEGGAEAEGGTEGGSAGGSEGDEEYDHVRTEMRCMYDMGRCGDLGAGVFDPGVRRADLQAAVDVLCAGSAACAARCTCKRAPLRDATTDELTRWAARRGGPRTKQKRAPVEGDFWAEPGGIGVAWTAMLAFFDGTRVDVAGARLDALDAGGALDRMRSACDRSMRVVVRYVLALRARAEAQRDAHA